MAEVETRSQQAPLLGCELCGPEIGLFWGTWKSHTWLLGGSLGMSEEETLLHSVLF